MTMNELTFYCALLERVQELIRKKKVHYADILLQQEIDKIRREAAEKAAPKPPKPRPAAAKKASTKKKPAGKKKRW